MPCIFCCFKSLISNNLQNRNDSPQLFGFQSFRNIAQYSGFSRFHTLKQLKPQKLIAQATTYKNDSNIHYLLLRKHLRRAFNKSQTSFPFIVRLPAGIFSMAPVFLKLKFIRLCLKPEDSSNLRFKDIVL